MSYIYLYCFHRKLESERGQIQRRRDGMLKIETQRVGAAALTTKYSCIQVVDIITGTCKLLIIAC